MAENVNIKIRAFDKTKKGFGSVTAGLKGITKSIFSMQTALIGVAGAVGFGFLIKSSLTASDALVKTASKIGTTADSLAGLRHAAELTGVATTTMDMALQRFTRRTAEAAKGTGEAKGAIRELGIDAKALNNMPLDQRMLVLSDAFSKVGNESDKLRLAFKLFDSEGAALVNTLSLGRDGLKDLLGEARALGLTMSDSAATGVEKANDSIKKLLALGKGVKDQFSAALAPAIEAVVVQLTEFFTKITDEGGGVEKWARDMAAGFLDATVVVVESLDIILTKVGKSFQWFKEQVTGFKKWARSADLAGFKKEADIASDAWTDLTQGNKPDVTGLGMNGLEINAVNLANRYYELQALITEIETDIAGGPETDWSNVINVDGFKANIERLKAIMEGGNGEGGLFKKTAEGLSDLQLGFKAWHDAIPDTTASVQALTKQGLDGLTDSLTAGVTGAANFADAMKSMAKSVVDSLIKMLIQKYIVDAAFGFITGSVGGGGGGAGTPGTTPGGGGQLAIGGSVQNGGSYLVGERGPEIFSPNASGSIIPNNKMGGGGITINQTINVTTGIQSTVRAEIVQLMPQIAQAAKGAVADARLRGGNFAKALVGA